MNAYITQQEIFTKVCKVELESKEKMVEFLEQCGHESIPENLEGIQKLFAIEVLLDSGGEVIGEPVYLKPNFDNLPSISDVKLLDQP